MRKACWLNEAHCCLQLGLYREAKELCTKVMDIDPKNVKAFFRRATALGERKVPFATQA